MDKLKTTKNNMYCNYSRLNKNVQKKTYRVVFKRVCGADIDKW